MATTKLQTEAEKAQKEALERRTAIAEADQDFRDAVKKAAEARDKVLEKYPDLGNVAEAAWNETKAEEGPLYKDVALTFRFKLDSTVDTIKQTGNADEIGLEEFEKRVVELLKERHLPVAGVIEKTEAEKKEAKVTTATPSLDRAKEDDAKRQAKARQVEAEREAELKRQAAARAKK